MISRVFEKFDYICIRGFLNTEIMLHLRLNSSAYPTDIIIKGKQLFIPTCKLGDLFGGCLIRWYNGCQLRLCPVCYLQAGLDWGAGQLPSEGNSKTDK